MVLDIKKTLVTNTEGHGITTKPDDHGILYPTKLDKVDFCWFKKLTKRVLEAVEHNMLSVSSDDQHLQKDLYTLEGATVAAGSLVRDHTVTINVEQLLDETNEARSELTSFIYAQSVTSRYLSDLFTEVIRALIKEDVIILPEDSHFTSASIVDLRQDLPDTEFKLMFSFTTVLKTAEEIECEIEEEDAKLLDAVNITVTTTKAPVVVPSEAVDVLAPTTTEPIVEEPAIMVETVSEAVSTKLGE